MTVRENLIEHLFQHGLWPDEAKTVVDLYAASEAADSMEGRWDHPEDHYPEVFYNALYLCARNTATRWLRENHPDHFALKILEVVDKSATR